MTDEKQLLTEKELEQVDGGVSVWYLKDKGDDANSEANVPSVASQAQNCV